MSADILEDAWSPRYANFVGGYARRLIARNFIAVRLLAGNGVAFREIAAASEPVMVVMNHSSWWDPMLVTAIRRMYFPGKPFIAPMDRVSLERFRFLRKCGLFGIDPDDPRALAAMTDYVQKRAAELPGCVVGFTPQGRFVDPRDPVRPRPGAASILARNPSMRLWSMSVEYGFWQDQRPEIFMGIREVECPGTISTASWQRRLGEDMESNQRILESKVRSRSAEHFETILGGRGGANHPMYDLWLRLRGKSPGIETGHRSIPSDTRR